MKQKLTFAFEVLVVIAIAAAIQKNFYKVPVVGPYLPGYA